MTEHDHEYCQCLYYTANALSRTLTRLADEEFSVTGLTSSYAFVLMLVNRTPGIQPTEISRKMLLSPSTVTRLIEKLESKQLVQRNCCGRVTRVMPMKKSLEMDGMIRDAWHKFHKRYTFLLGEDHSRNLSAMLLDAGRKIETENLNSL